LIIILVSCNKYDVSVFEEGNSSVSVPLQINNISFKDVSTRSATVLSSGDIGVFRLASLGYLETMSNVHYTNSGSGWDIASGVDPIYLTKSSASLCAYSPYRIYDATFTDETFTLNSQLYSESADLCYQTDLTAVSGTPVSFTLEHAYAKLVFNLTRDASYSGDCAISKIRIANDGILVSNTLDISTGSYGSGTIGLVEIDPGISSISSGSSVSVSVLMVPTVVPLSGDITLIFTIDGEDQLATVDVSSASLASLKAGNDYILNVTINEFIPEVTTANCYMIAPGNSLEIPVNVRGNGVEVTGTGISASIDPGSVGLLWETSPGLISLGDMSDDKKVTITTNNTTSGNAVIAAYSGENQTGDILWSWHIWVTDYDPSTGATFTVTNSAGASYVFMDRNLGATSSTPGEVGTLGLLYQWGRKDPFPGSASTSATSEPTIYNVSGTTSIFKTAVSSTSNLPNAIKNPLTFYYGTSANTYDWFSVTASTHNDALWGGAYVSLSIPAEKTMFDPSPAGWRVPPFKDSASPWTAFSTSTFSWNATYLGCTYTDGSFYPAAGYQYSTSGALASVGSGGCYWSGSPNGSNGYYLGFLSGNVNPAYYNYRATGFSVRCVQE